MNQKQLAKKWNIAKTLKERENLLYTIHIQYPPKIY